jgi:excinuclease ABC subunit C
MNLEKVKKLNIPRSPGCYFFLGKEAEIIYIGKAADLRSRVVSYWQKGSDHTPAKYSMLKKVGDIQWIETDTEIEALLLESNLIKKHQPPYNVALRDDKRYAYIKISTEEKWPRVFMTRKIDRQGTYFGPFVSVEAVKQTLKIIRKIWPFRSCRTLPRRVCLYYRIGKCPGMCQGYADEQEYKKTIKQISLFLEGKKKKVLKEMEKRLKELEKQLNKQDPNSPSSQELQQRMDRYQYQLRNFNRILEHSNILSLIDKYAGDVAELAKMLGLSAIPQRIEGYDISTIFGSQAVGSMVVFTNGEADKGEYRKFKIKCEGKKTDDAKMLKEVLERRLRRLNDKKAKQWPKPDLLIIDGGRQQLNAALSVLKKLSLDIMAISISKGNGQRSARARDKIFFPGKSAPLSLPLNSPALHIIKRVRDEAHRFAIEYHKKLRRKKYIN